MIAIVCIVLQACVVLASAAPVLLQPGEPPFTLARRSGSGFTAWMLKQLEAHNGSSSQDLSVQLLRTGSVTAPLFGASSALWPARVACLSASAPSPAVLDLAFSGVNASNAALVIPEGTSPSSHDTPKGELFSLAL
jgi:hypothetical protein